MTIKFSYQGKDYEVKETLADRFVAWRDPVKGAQRRRARVEMALAGGYTGGSKSKRAFRGWHKSSNDADADIIPDLPELRDNSGDLIRNNPLAAGAINTVCTSVVGSGLTVNAAIDGDFLRLTDEQTQQWQSQAERLFYDFAESKECDLTRTQNFFEQQDLFFRSTLERGDVFVALPYRERSGSQYGLKTVFIEADRVCNEDGTSDTDTLRGGIELDSVGAPARVHILKTSPNSYRIGAKREWSKIPVFGRGTGRRNILHGFERTRVGQHRGVPYLAPVIESFKQLGRYTEAELMAAVVSGMFTVFIKSESGEAEFDFGDHKGDSSAQSDDIELGNGAVVGLGENDSVDFANPGRPNALFDPFVMAIIRQIGVALEVPFELMVKHFTASYSASRAALLEAWRFFKKRRVWLVRNFCQPVYEAFITEQVAAGRLDAPGFFTDPLIRRAYLKTEWIGRPMGHIQPLQEAKAVTERLNNGVTTLQKESREYDGGEWEQNHKQRVREVTARKVDGIEYEMIDSEELEENRQ